MEFQYTSEIIFKDRNLSTFVANVIIPISYIPLKQCVNVNYTYAHRITVFYIYKYKI